MHEKCRVECGPGFSDPPQFFNRYGSKTNEETIERTWQFDVHPFASSTIGIPTTTFQYATKQYVDNVGAGGFTASNIGTGLTLRANGTSPETMDINTTTTAWWPAFIINSGGFFDINTSSASVIHNFWNDRYNATTTKPLEFTFSDNLTVSGSLTVDGLVTVPNLKATSTITTLTAGETITAKDAVVCADNLVWRTDADVASTTVQFCGFAKDGASTAASVDVFTAGIIGGFSGLSTATSSNLYFLSGTKGAISNATGTVEMVVGRAITATQLLIQKPTHSQFISRMSTGASVDVPQDARMAIVDYACTGGTASYRNQVTLFKNGANIQTIETDGADEADLTIIVKWQIDTGIISLAISGCADGSGSPALQNVWFYY